MSNSFAQNFPSPATVDMETPHGSPEPDPTQKMDVSPRLAANFAAPTFEAFAQAPTSSGPLSNIQESGLSEVEFEEITKEEFERTISATAHVLCRQVNAPNVPKDARKLTENAAQISESRIHDDQPLETSDNHGATSAEHDDSLVTEDHHEKLETAPPSTNHIQPTSQKSTQSVLFELEDELLQERKKGALLNNQPICASFVASPSAINPALITQPNSLPNTGSISNPPLSPPHENSTAQSPVQPNIQSDSRTPPTRSTKTTNIYKDTLLLLLEIIATKPGFSAKQSPQTGSSQNNSNTKESTGKNTPEEQLAALVLDSMDIDLLVPCLLPEIDPALAMGTESNTQNLFSSKSVVFVAAFKKFPIRMTPAKYSEGCDLVLKLLELRLKHIPTIINPKYLLPKGFKFHDTTTMTGTAWLSELNQQGVDFASPHKGELLFNSDIWSPWLFEPKEDPPNNNEHSITFQIYIA
ncbi:hypothetical protein DFH28DRAFT_1177396 [Melampsora americana]|nr:hypothetical protein DFH28DRAFT_1177396 [Melampsora americana]